MVLHKLCISQQESGMQYTYPKVNIWRKTNYIEAQRLQKNDMPQRHSKERNKQSKDTNGDGGGGGGGGTAPWLLEDAAGCGCESAARAATAAFDILAGRPTLSAEFRPRFAGRLPPPRAFVAFVGTAGAVATGRGGANPGRRHRRGGGGQVRRGGGDVG